MTYQPQPNPPNFDALETSLVNSRTQTSNNALYQTIKGLINFVRTFQLQITNNFKTISRVVAGIVNLTYLTVNDETASLPHSVQLLPGHGIQFDDTVANQRKVNEEIHPFLLLS